MTSSVGDVVAPHCYTPQASHQPDALLAGYGIMLY
nr:MAG TPA: hypothetical protein [Caudoviricetes sp.]